MGQQNRNEEKFGIVSLYTHTLVPYRRTFSDTKSVSTSYFRTSSKVYVDCVPHTVPFAYAMKSLLYYVYAMGKNANRDSPRPSPAQWAELTMIISDVAEEVLIPGAGHLILYSFISQLRKGLLR